MMTSIQDEVRALALRLGHGFGAALGRDAVVALLGELLREVVAVDGESSAMRIFLTGMLAPRVD